MRRKPISAVMSAMLLLISPLLQAQDRCGDVGPSVAVGGGTAWQKGISVTLYIVSTTADPISSAQQMTISAHSDDVDQIGAKRRRLSQSEIVIGISQGFCSFSLAGGMENARFPSARVFWR